MEDTDDGILQQNYQEPSFLLHLAVESHETGCTREYDIHAKTGCHHAIVESIDSLSKKRDFYSDRHHVIIVSAVLCVFFWPQALEFFSTHTAAVLKIHFGHLCPPLPDGAAAAASLRCRFRGPWH